MKTSRRLVAAAAAIVLASSVLLSGAVAVIAAESASDDVEYVVLAEESASASSVRRAIEAAGGTVVAVNGAIGAYTVLAPASGFVLAVSASAAVEGAVAERVIGLIPGETEKVADPIEGESAAAALAAGKIPPTTAGMDPLDSLAWGLHMVRSDLARAVNAGDRRVLVGIIDSGIDASHPDLAPNLETALSRNFTQDIPSVDGPCEVPSCIDPSGVDDNGHGTHVAGTVAAAANGFGISGVAPGVRLVSLRGGQDSGFLFLGPVVNALTYGADIGVDVINMSFYVDPWLFNCEANPADSPEAQLEQRTTIATMNRALNYANKKKVTLIGSMGNNHEDLGHPRTDLSSPDFPLGSEYPRPIDNETCSNLPIEGAHVIGVSALGPSGAKADYSNYGIEQTSVSAPGGYFRDNFGTPQYRVSENQILSTWPRNVLAADGWIDASGNITPAGIAAAVVKHCDAAALCAYYRYIQGTSMAAPHATGVAALAVSRFGTTHGKNGLRLDPRKTELVLLRGAAEHACPVPALVSYANVGRPAEFDALCEGNLEFNGFYGHGIVDAYATVTDRFRFGNGVDD